MSAAEQHCTKGCGAPCGTWPHCPKATGDPVYLHITPLSSECEHEWPLEDEHGTAMNQNCPKCGISFIHYIHTECP